MNARRMAGVVLLVVLGVLGVYVAAEIAASNYTFLGSVIEPAVPAQDFALARADGGEYRLAERRGQVVVMFFGYTSCPDFCPTTMGELKLVAEALGAEAAGVDFVFITVDPARDTPAVVQEFASGFNPAFIGLSGSEEELSAIWQAYFVYRARLGDGSDPGYLMDHTTRVIVVDKAGNFRMTFPYGIGPAAIESDLRYLLSEKE